ncbi:MAG: NADPH-dependent oxidoreductase [Flavobacteriales bacterium]|nr:MAG: NADPH-dependent oxidoreductase [Flavobacteriales bacterium]
MKKIIAFAGSNSRESINKKLVVLTANKIKDISIKVLDLNEYQLPLYGIDHENEFGIPNNAQKFFDKVKSADGIILSLAEHNGAYTAVFKNMFDWMSRIDGKLWNYKPMFLMSTSTGERGGRSVLEIAKARFPFMGGNIVAEFSLPFFEKNYSYEGLLDSALEDSLNFEISKFKKAL